MFRIGTVQQRRNSLSSRRDIQQHRQLLFDNFFNDTFAGFFTTVNPIRADIRETDKEYIIEADLPGVRKEDIRLELEDGILTLGVEQNEQINEESENYIRRERRCSSYCRSFRVRRSQGGQGVRQIRERSAYRETPEDRGFEAEVPQDRHQLTGSLTALDARLAEPGSTDRLRSRSAEAS